MPMGYEQSKSTQNNLNALISGRIKIESEDFLIDDVPGDGQRFFHTLMILETILFIRIFYKQFEMIQV
jgi:hypothetical protein